MPRISRRLVLTGLWATGAAALLPKSAHARPELRLVSTTSHATLQRANPDFPVPADQNQVFYIQRSMNANTVVYAASFDAAGNLDRRNPLTVYWRRYARTGNRKAMNWLEDQFVWGVRTRKLDAGRAFRVRFAPLGDLPVTLRQGGAHEAAMWVTLDNREYRMVYAFLDLDETGVITTVKRLRLYTSDPETGRYVTHYISVSGGELLE